MSLIEQLRNEIGLESPNGCAPSILGTKVMKELLMLWRQTELF
jgi:hypothetical protein